MVDVVHEIVAKYESKAKNRGIIIKIIGEKNIPNVQGDTKSLERAVTALVDNAIKFSAPSGLVAIRFSEQSDQVKISVEDHGAGIAPEIRPRIFDRFVHLEKGGDELYGGLGIGLSITRQVIQQHKGSLDMESEYGKGSTFTISLLKWK